MSYLSQTERRALLIEALGNPQDLTEEEDRALTWLVRVGDNDMARAFAALFRRGGKGRARQQAHGPAPNLEDLADVLAQEARLTDDEVSQATALPIADVRAIRSACPRAPSPACEVCGQGPDQPCAPDCAAAKPIRDKIRQRIEGGR